MGIELVPWANIIKVVSAELSIDVSCLTPGMRLAVGLSGGADSVSLLLALASRARELGLVLHAAHLHHGLRGIEADQDRDFCGELAARIGVPFFSAEVDTKAESAGESIEEAARRLRYAWFRQLMRELSLDAVVTAHTLDDQAETVLAKMLRGAWTEGLSGIYPVVEFAEDSGIRSCVIRPLLNTRRAEVEAYLKAAGQTWREDSSNRDRVFTRNRIRHDLLPELEQWNPRLKTHLAQMATLARDEEIWWKSEVSRIAPQMVLAGRPVRGGGRASGASGLAVDVTRLACLAIPMQRRLLRHMVEQLGTSLDFEATEALRELAGSGKVGKRLDLSGALVAERTARELRLIPSLADPAEKRVEYTLPLPGVVEASAFGLRFEAVSSNGAKLPPDQKLTIRNWKPGDRVTLRYSSGPKKVKEVLERLGVKATDRGLWPVIELAGKILWMQGVELDPVTEVVIRAMPLDLSDSEAGDSFK